MHVGMKHILVITLTTLACSKAAQPVRDAGVDKILSDTATPQFDTFVSLAVDFAIEGCPSFDAQALTCTGKVPLAVRFVPLATTTVTQYYWDFGDTTPVNGESAPSHTYTTSGVYSAKVVAIGVNGVVVSKVHTGFIIAQANPIGDPCDSNAQCEKGLFCLCPTSAPCNPGPAHGLCASSCETGVCGDGEVCAELRTATPPAGKISAWQGPLCLRACMKDEDCSAGLSCRTLPPGPAAGSDWIHGCFATVPSDIGNSCVDDEGNLRNDLCANGLCADLGFDGMCSMDCTVASCPMGSDCAVFGDGRQLCLRSCTNFACSQDPLLTCVGQGLGALGYQLMSPSSTTEASTYCAPIPCSLDNASEDKCLPTGTCVYDVRLSHCVKRSH
jgi:PKD repeat protein